MIQVVQTSPLPKNMYLFFWGEVPLYIDIFIQQACSRPSPVRTEPRTETTVKGFFFNFSFFIKKTNNQVFGVFGVIWGPGNDRKCEKNDLDNF